MRHKLLGLILSGLSVLGSGRAAAQPHAQPRAGASTPQSIQRPPIKFTEGTEPVQGSNLTPEDLSAYLGGMVPLQLVRGDLAGAAVIIIHNGQVLAKQGYGFADVSQSIAIDPDQTMFRLASISKLMTYVSAMQLVEQGRLDLDTDVNRYLDFKIEPAFGKPITLRTLMTHTAGFENQQQYVLERETDTHISLRDYLIRFQPKRIYPPGEIGSYSEYGVGLIGYIVEHISGERFEDYVQHHIFDPLGMAHSTFEQPMKPELRPLLSQGYSSTAEPPLPFEVFNPSPAGGMTATLADLARFSQAMLNDGEFNAHRILQPGTVAKMWTRQFAVSPDLPAMCLGFYEVDRNGLRFIGHQGDTRVFHTQLEIQPENKLILLSAYNSTGADGSGQDSARWEVLDGFLDRYFPYHQQPQWKPVDTRAREIEGRFIKARRIESGRMKLDSLLQQIQIRVNADGELINKVAVDTRGHAIKLRYLGDDLWQDELGQGRIMALRDKSGRVTALASMFGATMMVRVPWWEDARFVIPFACFALVSSLLVLCSALFHLGRRFVGQANTPNNPASVPFTTAQYLAALVWIPAVPLLLVVFLHIAREPLPAFDHVPYYFLLQNVLTSLAILLSIPGIIFAVKVTTRTEARMSTRLKHALIALSYVFLTWFSLHWHLIGSIQRY